MSTRQVVYLKIPVERGGFIDSPDINWSEAKEQALWEIISKSKRSDIDWIGLSEKFSVPTHFLQQQVFWLYEQELEQLKSKIRRTTLSSDTIIESRSETVPLRSNESTKPTLQDSSQGQTNIFSRQTLSINEETEVRHDDSINGSPENSSTSSSPSSTSSSNDSIDHGSILLYRSRILSKVPPRFGDIDENEEDEEEAPTLDQQRYFQDNRSDTASEASKIKTATDSNLSSISISKSALEEALLDQYQF